MEKGHGISVPQNAAEGTLLVLRRLKLIDSRFQIHRSAETIVIPILRKPSDQEMSELRECCQDVELREAIFKESSMRPRDLQEAILGQIPEDLIPKLPRSFDVIGDIALFELPEELEKFSSIIGNAILGFNPRLRLVLRKASDISGTYRTRKFEVIAGAGGTETVYREFSCSFRLDVASVYFSPRLSNERLRIAKQAAPGETIVDMFAGAGPYSIIIAHLQPRVKIYSIDVNPDAYRYLKENILVNKVADRVVPILGDVRQRGPEKLQGLADRVIMNFPSAARYFVDVTNKLLKQEGGIVHYYVFASRDQSLTEIQESFRAAVEARGRKVQSFTFGKVIKEVAPSRVQVAIDAIVK